MIKPLFLFAFVLCSLNDIYSQCRVQTNQREDGATIRYMSPDRIGRSDNFMMAASMQANGSDYYVAVLSIFPSESQNLSGNMTIKFENNKSSILEHIISNPTTFNGYPATISIFYADSNDLKNIETSKVKIIMVKLISGPYQTVAVTMNPEILQLQYQCLKN